MAEENFSVTKEQWDELQAENKELKLELKVAEYKQADTEMARDQAIADARRNEAITRTQGELFLEQL